MDKRIIDDIVAAGDAYLAAMSVYLGPEYETACLPERLTLIAALDAIDRAPLDHISGLRIERVNQSSSDGLS